MINKKQSKRRRQKEKNQKDLIISVKNQKSYNN